MMCHGLAQEYSHAHVVMVIIDMLKILCRMRMRNLMMIIMLRDMTMHMLRGGADENDDDEGAANAVYLAMTLF